MKVSDRTLLWAAWLMLVIGVVWDNQRLRERVDNLEQEIEFQENVDEMLYRDLHELSHSEDSLWYYK
jgi:hypothetical protein